MEGDAGASRLNPTDADESASEVGTDQAGTEVTAESLPETDATDTAEITAEDQGSSAETAAEPGDVVAPEPPVVERGPSRLGRRWLLAVAAALLLLAIGAGVGGLRALCSHRDSEVIARDNAAAIAAAKDCVAATQAPDAAAMAEAERKIIECSTGDFGAQAALYSGIFVQAYQAANVHVQVSDMRAAVESHNDDGSVNLLVAVRVKVDNVEDQGSEHGYRLRVKMAREDGQYKIAQLDQVSK